MGPSCGFMLTPGARPWAGDQTPRVSAPERCGNAGGDDVPYLFLTVVPIIGKLQIECQRRVGPTDRRPLTAGLRLLAETLGKAWRERQVVPIEPRMTFGPAGLVLGAGTVLAASEPVGGGRAIRLDGAEARLLALLAAAYGRTVGVESLGHIRRAALRWSEGEEVLASVHLAMTGLGRLTPRMEAARRLFMAEGLMDAGASPETILRALDLKLPDGLALERYSPNQPRVPVGSGRASGQWTSEGDEVSGNAPVEAVQSRPRHRFSTVSRFPVSAKPPDVRDRPVSAPTRSPQRPLHAHDLHSPSNPTAVHHANGAGGGGVPPGKMSEGEREKAAEADYRICRSLNDTAARARCWESAAERDGARATGRPVPPLTTERDGLETQRPSEASTNSALQVAGASSSAALLYWIVSEASRVLFPPRNLVPVP